MDLIALFKLIFSLSFMGSILAVIILLTKKLFKTRLSANWHYYIWLLLVIRLIMPYAPESSLSIFNLLPAASENMETVQNVVGNIGEKVSFSTINEKDNTSKEIINDNVNIQQDKSPKTIRILPKEGSKVFNYGTLSIIWASGVAIMLLCFLITNVWFLLQIRKKPQCKEKTIVMNLSQCKSRMGVYRDISIIYDDYLRTPSLFGIIKPKLLVSPEILYKLSEEEKRYVFLHELAHFKRKDILINWLLVIIQALHWFNPIIWYAFNKIHEDCEVACDAYVLSKLTPVEYRRYGETIISLIGTISRQHWKPVTTGMANNRSNVKRRIRMIAKFKRNPWKWSVMAFIIVLGIIIIGMTDGYNNILKINNSPMISVAAEIRKLTLKEFSEVGTTGLQNPTINDFRKIVLKAEITNVKNVISKEFNVPDLYVIQDALKSTGDRFWYSDGSDQNNDDEEFSRAERSIVIYYKGVEDSDIREALKPLKIQIGWTEKDRSKVSREYSVGEILTFENEKNNKNLKEDTALRNTIIETLKKSNGIDFAQIGSFDWETMYIFTPYSNPKSLLMEEGVTTYNSRFSIELNDSINMLAFVKSDKLVSFIELPRKYGNVHLTSPMKFSKGKSKFNISKENNSIILKNDLGVSLSGIEERKSDKETMPNLYAELDKLPREYNSKLAQENGDVVYIKGKVYNLNKLADFYAAFKDSKAELPKAVRITQYTTEGHAIINDLVISDEVVKLIVDNTRDEFMSSEDRKITEYKVSDIVIEKKNNAACYTVKVENGKGLFSFYVN
jgi:beta-lactamase regulating signal transducer with metallopeptidase domain